MKPSCTEGFACLRKQVGLLVTEYPLWPASVMTNRASIFVGPGRVLKKVISIAVLVGLILYSMIMWVATEHDLEKSNTDKAELQTDFDMLESSFNAQDQQLKDTGKDLAEKMQTINDLQKGQEEQQDKIADLERQLQSARASRSQNHARLLPATTKEADFWRRLANCENAAGDDDDGYFQFTDPNTAAWVGYKGNWQSYEVQRDMAIRWAAHLRSMHISPGSTQGWPHCWWEAGGG